ncbi:MAG: hypothetical protein IPK92_22370 [Nitrospira sp.]|nr:hypothetical protein [Nitrospira sp.]
MPYRGLKALEADDAAIFFGRDAEIVACLDRLRKLRQSGGSTLLVLLGASGSGKSSFLRAGLWPRLHRNDRAFLPLPVIRPERAVLHGESGLAQSLSRAFAEYNTKKNLAEIRTGLADHAGFQNLLTELQKAASKDLPTDSKSATIFLPIDQGEELFTTDGRSEAETLLGYLGQSLVPEIRQGAGPEATRPHIIVLIAIRSDSYEPLQIHPALRQAAREQFDLLPIVRDDYKEVILKPAERATMAGRKLTVDPDLVKALREEAEGADALPLIAYTLERLFVEHGSDGDLRLDEYQTFGGVKGALDSAIASALRNPSHDPKIPDEEVEQHRCLRAAFIPWLARIDPETETRKRRVARLRDIPEESHTLIARLVNARLLTSSSGIVNGTQETLLEVAHEALLRQWPTLTNWLDEDADQLKTAETVRRDAAEWDKKGRGDEWLDLRGDRLKVAEDLRQRPDLWALLTQQGQAYISQCRIKEDRARAERENHLKKTAQMQSRIWKLMTAVALALIAGIVGVTLQTREIGHQTSLVLATAAQTASDAGHVDRALRFAVLATTSTWLSPTSIEAEPQLARSAHASAVQVLLTHEGRVNSGTFSPDGTKVITASNDKTARVWDAATGKELVRLSHENPVRSATVTPDGTRVVTLSNVSSDPWSHNGSSFNGETVRVWDMATGKVVVQLIHEGIVRSAIVTADCSKVITISDDKAAQVWDAATSKELAQFPHKYPIWTVTISADGTKVVTASGDKTARVWNVATGKEVARFVHEEPIESLSITADGTKVVTASKDNAARVWDVATRKELARFAHEEPIELLSITTDGTKVVTASGDKTARVWNVATGKELARIEHEEPIESLSITADGTKVVTTSDNKTVHAWDGATGSGLAQFSHEYRVWSVSITANGTSVVTASDDRTARVWNVATGKELARFVHKKPVESATMTADNTRIVTASKDNTARVWDVATGKELARFAHEEASGLATSKDVSHFKVFQIGNDAYDELWMAEMNPVWSPTITADGSKVVTTSDDKTAQIWDVATGKELARFPHENPIDSATITADGTKVVTTPGDKTARVWDVATGKELARFVHEEPIESVSITADGAKVVTASDDKTARVWDVATGKELARFAHKNFIRSATITADGSKVVTTSPQRLPTHTADPFRTVESAAVLVWNIATGKELAEFTHKGTLRSANVTTDGTRIVTTSHDNSARIWDVATGMKLARFAHESSIQSATISADNAKVVTSSEDNSARVWDAHWLTQYHGQELIQRVCQEKLIGASHITARDIEISPILSGRKGEDVCDPPSWISQLAKSLGFAPKSTTKPN